jgi:hypothetical protein
LAKAATKKELKFIFNRGYLTMKKFTLADLMTAAQAQKIIEYLDETNKYIDNLETRVYELEKKIENFENAKLDRIRAEIEAQQFIYDQYYRKEI